jgi:hypothetical protein
MMYSYRISLEILGVISIVIPLFLMLFSNSFMIFFSGLDAPLSTKNGRRHISITFLETMYKHLQIYIEAMMFYPLLCLLFDSLIGLHN